MKKAVIVAIMLLASLVCAGTALAAGDWDQFIAKVERQNRIKDTGRAIVTEMLKRAPQGTEFELWKQLWVGEADTRAAAAIALIYKIFPEGDVSRWQEVSGFLSGHEASPRQLAAIDGLFVAVAKLKELPDGLWASAYLLSRFGESGIGKVKFIDDIPADMRAVIDDVIAETELRGDWSSVRIRGRLPMLPRYGGFISREIARSRDMQYIDGRGSLSSNGRYAWDREQGYIYEVVDNIDRFFIFQ